MLYSTTAGTTLVLLVRRYSVDRFGFNTLPDLQECYVLEFDLTQISIFSTKKMILRQIILIKLIDQIATPLTIIIII